jgi:hypothetical protein
MRSEPRSDAPGDAHLTQMSLERHRIRNAAWYLKRRANRRRNRANAMVIGSLFGVLFLCRVFYALLTR